jgi:hypothetical protein
MSAKGGASGPLYGRPLPGPIPDRSERFEPPSRLPQSRRSWQFAQLYYALAARTGESCAICLVGIPQNANTSSRIDGAASFA